MHHLKLICLVTFVAWSLPAWSQIDMAWDTLLGERGHDEAVGAVQSYDGSIGILGKTQTDSWSDDFWWLQMDPDGRIIQSRAYGTVYSDRPVKVLNHPGGGYWLLGTVDWPVTQAEGKKNVTNPLVIKLDAQGQKEYTRIIFLDEDAEVLDGALLSTGKLFLLIAQRDQQYVVDFSQKYINLNDFRKLPVDHEYARMVSNGGELLLFGLDDRDRLVTTWLQSGQSHAPHSKWFETTMPITRIGQIKSLSDSLLYIAATVKAPRAATDVALLRLNLGKQNIVMQHLGGRLHEEANALTFLPDGSHWVAGSSLSNREQRSRVADGFFAVWDAADRPSSYFTGGTEVDEIKDLLVLQDGHLLALQTTASGDARRRDMRISKYLIPETIDDQPLLPLQVKQFALVEEEIDGTIEPAEEAFVRIEVMNPNASASPPMDFSLKINGLSDVLLVPDTVSIGVLAAGEAREMQIPLLREHVFVHTKARLSLSGPVLDSNLVVDFELAGFSQPQLVLGEGSLRLGDTADARNPYLVFSVETGNGGTASSSGGQLILDHPASLSVTKRTVEMPNLTPGAMESQEFVLMPGNLQGDTLIRLTVVWYDDHDSLLLRRQYEADIRQILAPLRNLLALAALDEKNSLVDLPKNRTISREELVIPTEAELDREPPVQYIVWNDPSPLKDYDQYKEYTLPTYPIRLAVISEGPVNEEPVSCNLYLNDLLYSEYEGRDKLTGGEQVSFYQYWYDEEVQLAEGENRIFLEIAHDGGETYRSDPMIINYTPPRSDAHIYAFGVPHDDLPYVSKDAEDFATLFGNQQNLLFGQVHTHLYNSPATTTIESLRRALINLENDYWKFERIKENDVIFIYFSTHGFTYGLDNEQFRLASSDFDRQYERLYSLDFKEDLLEVLRPMRCKIILIMDACYSGQIASINAPVGVKGMSDSFDLEMSKAIMGIAETENDLYFLLSCEPEEKSYADEAWRNSAFTKALVEYLDPTSGGVPLLPDMYSDDPIITLGELYSYLAERVPEIVRSKEDIDTLQHPILVNGDAVKDLPIYVRN